MSKDRLPLDAEPAPEKLYHFSGLFCEVCGYGRRTAYATQEEIIMSEATPSTVPDRDSLIREKAYHLWVADGSPSGLEMQHWIDAQRLVHEMDGASMPSYADARKHYEGGISAQPPICTSAK